MFIPEFSEQLFEFSDLNVQQGSFCLFYMTAQMDW